MRIVKRYNSGGRVGKPTDSDRVSVRKMSDRAYSDDLGSEEQLLADALAYQGYGVGDLLSMLNLTNKPGVVDAQSAMDAIFSGEEAVADEKYRAHIKDGTVRLAERKSVEEGYYPSRGASFATDEAYEYIAGRELSPSEERFMRRIMKDPALASYFMDIYGKESSDTAKVRVKNVGPRSTGNLEGRSGGPDMPASCRGGSCAFD